MKIGLASYEFIASSIRLKHYSEFIKPFPSVCWFYIHTSCVHLSTCDSGCSHLVLRYRLPLSLSSRQLWSFSWREIGPAFILKSKFCRENHQHKSLATLVWSMTKMFMYSICIHIWWKHSKVDAKHELVLIRQVASILVMTNLMFITMSWCISLIFHLIYIILFLKIA